MQPETIFPPKPETEPLPESGRIETTQAQDIVSGMAIEKRWGYLQLSQGDARLLQEMHPLMVRHAEGVVEEFYNHVAQFPELVTIIGQTGIATEALKATQRDYLLGLFSGDYGADYVAKRYKIGLVHYRIGLDPSWYIGGYSIYFQLLLPLIVKRYRFRPFRRRRSLIALNRLLALDMQLAMEAYIQSLVKNLKRESLSREAIEGQVKVLGGLIEGVSRGDLRARFDVVASQGDMSQLGEWLNTMIGNLGRMALNIRNTGQEMAAALKGVRNAAKTQSAGASRQAAAIHETIATLEEIKNTSRQNLEKAQGLGGMADHTQAEGERGLVAMEESVAAVREIRQRMENISEAIQALSHRTQRISEITAAVDNLAQQSKMVALNASIEAAKAGEAGKGFAVVADEVKNLAEQSHQFTSQVHRILEEIRHSTNQAVVASEEGGKGVDRGLAMMEETGALVENLSQVIRETAMASQQIGAAVRQEFTGIDQISIAMTEINRVTEEFVAAAREMDRTTDVMTQHVRKLETTVSAYKV
ncbi:MAG: hypothetical protein HQL52_01765 [Magnetococcales bacterium]|nr:hypothetical protein [Magnetococcales bacterium]